MFPSRALLAWGKSHFRSMCLDPDSQEWSQTISMSEPNLSSFLFGNFIFGVRMNLGSGWKISLALKVSFKSPSVASHLISEVWKRMSPLVTIRPSRGSNLKCRLSNRFVISCLPCKNKSLSIKMHVAGASWSETTKPCLENHDPYQLINVFRFVFVPDEFMRVNKLLKKNVKAGNMVYLGWAGSLRH